MKWIVLIAGIAVASVALAILAFAVPSRRRRRLHRGLRRPAPPEGFVVVCYDKVVPGSRRAALAGLTIDIAAVIALEHAINDAMRGADPRQRTAA